MKKYVLITMLVSLLLVTSLWGRDWEWVSGGNFYSIDAQNVINEDPSDDVIWLGGNLLVKGVRQNGSWKWTQVAPELTENSWISRLTFFDVISPSGGIIGCAFALNSSGVVYSGDRGSTWTTHPLPDWISYLNRFQVVDIGKAYAVGRNIDDQAILVHTENAGVSWELIYDSGEWPGVFTGLKVYPDGHATLTGNYYSNWMGWLGVIIETSDDFQTVSRVDYDDQVLTALAAPTEDHHYALGGPDLPGSARPIFVYRHSQQGGWTESSLPYGIFQIADMHFTSGLHGYVVGQFDDPDVGVGGVILETIDGGETWSRTDFCARCVTDEPIVEEQVNFLTNIEMAGDDMFAVQTAGLWPCSTNMCTGRVLTSTDGEQWNQVAKLSGYSYVDIDLGADYKNGIAVGNDGHIWGSFTRRVSNGSWQDPIPQLLPCSFLGQCGIEWGEVHQLDESELWATAKTPNNPAQLIRSLDQEKSWSDIDTGETLSFANPKLSIASPDSIWAIVSTNENIKKIISTSDRGENWSTVVDNGNYLIQFVSHVSEQQFCWVGRSMACTKNGGVNWSYPAGPSSFKGLQLLDEEYGWSFGVSSQGNIDVYRTIDGGTIWSKLASLDKSVADYPSQMKFINRQEGWLVAGERHNSSNAAVMFRTEDGGETWTEESDGVFFDGEIGKGFIFDIAPDGTGWLASRHSGMLLKRTKSGPVAPGDSNGDGKVDSGDLLQLVKSLNNGLASGEGGDCNQDGKVDVGDLICVVKKLSEK